jgi:hypothetical protein
MKQGSEIIILLTSTINPQHASKTKLQNPHLRQQQYESALDYYLNNFNYKIVFVDNSNFNISSSYNSFISERRLEILCFEGLNYPRELGKGYGEMKIIEYALNHSGFINEDSVIVKITGRLKLLNLANILSKVTKYKKNTNFISAEFMISVRAAGSRIIIASHSFYCQYLFAYQDFLNDSKGYYFEHALANAIKDSVRINNYQYIPLPLFSRFKGYSGTFNKKYSTNLFFYFFRSLYSRIKGNIVIVKLKRFDD